MAGRSPRKKLHSELLPELMLLGAWISPPM